MQSVLKDITSRIQVVRTVASEPAGMDVMEILRVEIHQRGSELKCALHTSESEWVSTVASVVSNIWSKNAKLRNTPTPLFRTFCNRYGMFLAISLRGKFVIIAPDGSYYGTTRSHTKELPFISQFLTLSEALNGQTSPSVELKEEKPRGLFDTLDEYDEFYYVGDNIFQLMWKQVKAFVYHGLIK